MPGSSQHQGGLNPGRAAARQKGGDILAVEVGPYHLALPAVAVLAIVEPLALHTLPWVGGGVLGVANFRNEVALAVSVRRKLGLVDLSRADAGQFLLTRLATGLTAFWVDQTLNLIDRRACTTCEIKTVGAFTPFWRCLVHQDQILFKIDFEILFALTPPKGTHLFQADPGNGAEARLSADIEPSVESGADGEAVKTTPSGIVTDPASAQKGRGTEQAGATVVKAKPPPALCQVRSGSRGKIPASAVDPGIGVVRPLRLLRGVEQGSAPVKHGMIRNPAPPRLGQTPGPVKITSKPWAWIGLAAVLFIALAMGWWLRPVPSTPLSSRATVLAAARAQSRNPNPASTFPFSQKALAGGRSAPLSAVQPVSVNEPRPAVVSPPIHTDSDNANQEAENQEPALEVPSKIPNKAETIDQNDQEAPPPPAAAPLDLQDEPRTPESGLRPPGSPVPPEPLRILQIQSDTFALTIERHAESRPEPTPLSPTGQKPSGEIIHVVVKGDTLWHIAIRYLGDPWRYSELAALSRIRDPDRIYPGDVIRIVKRGKGLLEP